MHYNGLSMSTHPEVRLWEEIWSLIIKVYMATVASFVNVHLLIRKRVQLLGKFIRIS